MFSTLGSIIYINTNTILRDVSGESLGETRFGLRFHILFTLFEIDEIYGFFNGRSSRFLNLHFKCIVFLYTSSLNVV